MVGWRNNISALCEMLMASVLHNFEIYCDETMDGEALKTYESLDLGKSNAIMKL